MCKILIFLARELFSKINIWRIYIKVKFCIHVNVEGIIRFIGGKYNCNILILFFNKLLRALQANSEILGVEFHAAVKFCGFCYRATSYVSLIRLQIQSPQIKQMSVLRSLPKSRFFFLFLGGGGGGGVRIYQIQLLPFNSQGNNLSFDMPHAIFLKKRQNGHFLL